MATPETTNINGYYFKDEASRNLISQEANTRQTQYNTMKDQLDTLVASGLVPYAVDSTSEMTNHNRIYVLKSTGKWYYYNTDNSTWTIGGDYQAASTLDVLYNVTKATNPKTLNLSNLTWIHGGVNANNHRLTTSPNDRIRFEQMIKLRAGSKINFTGVSAGFQFKASLYSGFTQYDTTFISEPVAFTDNAASLTIPVDCWVMISIKRANGSDISDDEYATVTGYISTSELFPCDDEPIYGDLTDKMTYYAGYKYNSQYGYVQPSSAQTLIAPVRVNPGDHIGVLKIEASDNRVEMYILNAKGEVIESDTSPQPAIGTIAPENARFVIFHFTTADKDNLFFRIQKKPVNYQATLGILTEGTKVKLVAHGGLEKFAPYETIPAYTIAGEKGLWANKLDIQETADGHFIMSHDNTVDRMTDGTGRIIDMTLDQLMELTVDAGEHIEDYPNEKLVTFEQALEICKKYNMVAMIDIKNISSTASIPTILSILESYGMIEQTVCQCSAGNRTWLSYLRHLNPNIPLLNWISSASSVSNLTLTAKHSALGWFNAVQMLSSWNSDYNTEAYLEVIKGFGMPLCVAVCDGENALTKAQTAIANGAIYIVTDQVTPADIAPDTYPA